MARHSHRSFVARSPWVAASLALLVSSALALAPRPPQDGVDPAKQIEKFERYLERRPYHDWAFDQLMDAAVKSNAVQALVERYEGRVASGGSTAERVIFARLLSRTDRVDEALESLRAIEDAPASLWQLVGSLELRRGAPAAAVEALERALAATTDRQELEALHRLRGEALLAAGDSARATAAFQALAALDPADFQLRLDAATALAHHGLTEAALAEFGVAQKIASDDIARRCRVLSEIGRLHEQLAQGDEALSVYREAVALMGRGNWLKRDLSERIIALHRRTKSLEELARTAGEAATAAPGDLDAQEFHARALREIGDDAGALAALTRATTAFPGDVPLARARIELLRSTGDSEGVVAEYQRILTEKPNELDLYLELGQAFAASGQLAQAKRQWQKTLDERLTDPGLAARLAGLYALYGEIDDAVAMYEKALALEPREIVRYSDLATYLKAVGRIEAIEAVLERAEGIAAGDAGRLDDVATLWREFDAPDRARATLESALALAPDDVRLVRRYADVQLEAGDLEGGTETLRRVIGLAADSGTRRSAVDRIMQGWWRAGREDELRERVAASDEIVDQLVHARLLIRRRESVAALAVHERLVAAAPELEEAREALAKLYEEAGELEAALDQYDQLIALRPQNRRKYLKDVAAIHLERYDQEAAFACYNEILSSSPDNASAFREVAKAYEQLGLVDKAIECHLQAIRLEPNDGRTRLELAELFRATGEWDRGEREIVAAFDAKDATSRKKARESYHALLAQEGRLAGEIQALRGRINKNPYDTAAPVTLTDLYVREQEFELALEMLDELLAYQPKSEALLRERARVLSSLERHGEAVETYEILWKMPDADQRAIALDIADAHIKRGDRAKAEEILTQLGDPDALARAYERNDLLELAIETLEQSVQRRPNDERLLDRLARLKERVRDFEGAVAQVERLAARNPDSWRTLKRLGELYHAAGRRSDALNIGTRLFSLVRIEDTSAPPKDEDETPKATRNAPPPRLTRTLSSGRSHAYDERIDELQSWYSTIEAPTEFADVAALELQRQPTNEKLLSSLVNAWSRKEGKGAALLAVLERVRAETVDVGRAPAGMPLEQWRRTLDSYTGRLALQDAPFGRERVVTLEAELAAEPNASKHRELADLLLDVGENEAALRVLHEGVAAHPEDVFLRTGLAEQLQRERKFEDAAAEWRRVLETLIATGVTNDVPEDEREVAYRAGRTATLRAFPIHMQRKLTDADLRQQTALTAAPRLTSSWYLGASAPTPGGVRMALARCLKESGDRDGARAAIAELRHEVGADPVADPANHPVELEDAAKAPLSALSSIASLYASLDFDAEARLVIERLARLEEALDVHPIHGFNRSWEYTVRGSRKSLVKILEREGDPLGAYDVLRELGAHDEGKLLLEEGKRHDAAVVFYTERAKAALAAGRDSEWRDEMVKLAEVHQHARRYDVCLATYREITARDPEDFGVRETIAKLFERAQRWQEAVDEHLAIIDAKRVANRRNNRQTTPEVPRLTPLDIPRAEGDNSWAWQNLANSSRYGGGTMPGKHSFSQHYTAVLKLLLDQREVERATAIMLQIAREDARNMSWLGYSFGEILQEYRLEAEGVPILRLLYSYNDTNDSLALNYGNALMAAKRFDEARRLYRAMLDRASTSDSYYREEASRQLKVAEKRLGLDTTEERAELEAKVASDPKNAKARIALAQRLFADEEDEAALEHALAAEAVAPHLDEVRALVERLLQVNGRHEELEARLTKKLDELKTDDERVRAAMMLADWLAERGDMEGVDALFARIRQKAAGRFQNSSPADWFSQRGDVERALAELELDLVNVDTWYKDRIRSKIAGLRGRLGDPRAQLDAAWAEFDKKTSKGEKSSALTTVVGGLLAFQHEPETLAALAAGATEAGGLRGGLELTAIDLVRGDARAAEERLHALVQQDRANAFLYPALVDLARARRDEAQALAYLEELYGLGIASESSMVGCTLGQLSEADLLRAEIGCLRFGLDDREGADAIWGAMFEPDDEQGLQVLAKLYRQLELWGEALAAQRAYIEKSGSRNRQTQQELADLLYESGDTDEALATFERLLVLADEGTSFDSQDVGPRVMRLYRELGRLDERRELLRSRLAKDADDVRGALELAKLEAEAGDVARAQELLEEVAARPDQLEQTAPVLIRAARARGDLDEACRWYEQLLAGNSDERTRRTHATNYGKILIERGEVDRAVEVVLGCYPDAESEEALGAAISLLVEQRQHARALELQDKLIAVAAKPENHVSQKVSLLRSLEREEEAFDVLGAALVDPKQRKQWMFDQYRALDADGRELERMTAALDAAPEDAALQLRWVTLASEKEERRDRCLALLEGLCAAEPRSKELQLMLVKAYITAERFEDALPHIEALLTRLDRDRAREDTNNRWEFGNQIQILRQQRIQALHRSRGASAALAAYMDTLGLAYEGLATSRGNYYYGNPSTKNVAQRRLRGLLELGRDDELQRELAGLEPRALALATSGTNADLRLRALRYRAGERDEVLELLFQRAFLAVSNPLVGRQVNFNSFDYYDEFEGYSSNVSSQPSPLAQELIRYYHEEDRLAELKERVQPLVDALPDLPEKEQDAASKQLRATLVHIERLIALDAGEDLARAIRAKKAEENLETLRERCMEDPFDPKRATALARALLQSKDGAVEALALLQDAEPLVRGQAYAGIQENVVIRRSSDFQKGAVRFAFSSGSSNSYGSSSSSWFSSSDSGQQDYLRLLAAAHFAVGDREAGLACEAKVDQLGATESGGWTYDPFTQTWTQGSAAIPAYAQLGLDVEVDRIATARQAEIALECAGDERRKQQRLDALADQVVTSLQQRRDPVADPEVLARWIAIRREGYETALATGRKDFAVERQFIGWLRRVAKDEAAWRARAEALVADPEWLSRNRQLDDGYLFLDLGQIAEARATFESLRAEAWSQPSEAVLDPFEVAEACCDAAEGELERARPILRRALATGLNLNWDGSVRWWGQSERFVREGLGLPERPE